MRAAVYCRISQDKTGEGLGVARQQEDCLALAERLGWSVVEVYVDNDISATSGKARPAYRRMLEALETGVAQAIVAWHPDRLYRKLADLEELIPIVESREVAIATVRAGDFDLATPTGRMIARILASVATGEVEVKADRWKRSVRQRREAGTWSAGGPRPFGWTVDGRLVKEEAELLRWAAGEVIAGRTLTSLARELNDRGATTTRGNPWQAVTLRTTLQNPRLAALATLRGEIVGPGSWEPVLDLATWETVVAVLAARKRRPIKAARTSLLLGLVHCGREGCGRPLVASGRTAGAGRGWVRTYRCQAIPGRPGMEGACSSLSVNAEQVEEIVEGFARVRFDDERIRRRVAALQSVEGTGALAAEAVALEQRIFELEQQLDEPGVPVAAILRAIDRAKERLESYRSQLADAAGAQVLTAAGGEWPEDLERRRRLIGIFVRRVDIDPAPAGAPRGVFDPDRVRIDPRF